MSGPASLALLLAAAPVQAAPIAFVYRTPASFQAGEPITVEGLMQGGADVESAELLYRTSVSGGWRNVELELVEREQYRAEIPAAEVEPPQIEIYVIAVDFLEGRHAAFASVEAPHVVPITGPASVAPSRQSAPAPEVEAPVESAPSAVPRRPADLPSTPSLPAAVRHPLATLDRAAIEALGARDLADVLAAMPDVELTWDLAGFRRVGVRGSRSPGDVLLLIDGQPANDPYDGGMLLSLPAAAIDEVTLWVGARQSAAERAGLYATIAVRTGGTDRSWRVRAAGGSHASELAADGVEQRGTYRAEGAGAAEVAGLGLAGFVSFAYSDGSYNAVGSDAHRLAAGASHAPGAVQDDRMEAAVGAKLALDSYVPGDLQLGAAFLYEDRGGYIGLVDTYGPHAGATEELWLAGLTYHMPLEQGRSLDARLGLDMHRFTRRYQLAPEHFVVDDLDGDSLREVYPLGIREEQALGSIGVSGELSAVVELPAGQRLSSGVSLEYHDSGVPALRRNIDADGMPRELESVAQPGARAETSRLALGAHIEDTWRALPLVTVVAGLQAHYWNDIAAPELFDVLNPRFEIAVEPAQALEIALLYGVLSRPPTVSERADVAALTLPAFLSDERFVGNPLLGPSAAHTLELSASVARQAGGLDYRGSASASWMRLLGAIEAVHLSAETDQISARGESERLGLTLEGAVGFGQRSELWLCAWWADAADRDGAPTRLASTPRTGALFGSRIELAAAADLALAVRYEGARQNNRRTALEETRRWRIPAQTTVDATLRSAPLRGGWRAALSAHNLFDADRRDPAPVASATPELVPRPGRLLLLSLEWTEGAGRN